MTIPIIALDIDGVLAEYGAAFQQLARSLHPDEGLSWNTGGGQRTWRHTNMTTAQSSATWDFVYEHAWWWNTLPTIPTKLEIDELAEFAESIGAHIEYVTSRGTARRGVYAAAITGATLEWLEVEGFPQVANLTLAKDKARGLDGLVDRVEGGVLLGMLDDKPATLSDLGARDYPMVVRDWPYNRGRVSAIVPRVYSLGEYVDLLRARHLRGA